MIMNLFRVGPGPWLNDPSPEDAPPSDPRPLEPNGRECDEERTTLAEMILGRHFRPRV